MKRFLCFIVCALLCITLSSCGNQNSPAGGDTSAAVPESQSEFDTGYIKSGSSFSTGWDITLTGSDWAGDWIESTYGGYDISNIGVQFISEGELLDISDTLNVHWMIYSVKFNSKKAIPDLGQDSNGVYTFEILCAAVIEKGNGIASLAGFMGPGQFNKQNILSAVYQMVSRDSRFSSKLKSLSKPNLPKEFQQIELNQILGGHYCFCARILPDGTAAALCADKIERSDQENIGVLLFNSKTKEVLNYVSIGVYENAGIESVIQGKIVFRAFKNASSGVEEVITVDSIGNVTREESRLDKNNVHYSPDGSKCTYSNKNCLYVADSDGSNPKLVISGIYSDGQDWKNYYPYAWLDDSKIVYGIGGYEWSSGCGVFDLSTGKDTFLQQVSSDAPIALINGKLFTSPMTMDVPLDPSVVDLNDTGYPARKIFENREFISIYMQNYAISPDGSKIAMLEYLNETSNPDDCHYKLHICSTDNGSVLKEYEFVTGSGNVQFMDFYDESHISMYGAQSIYSGDCIYIVNIQ